MRELLEVAYVTEYGLEADEQSALNFIFLIGTGDLSDAKAFELLGESDERYKVRGGNQRIADELARRLEPQIERRHRLRGDQEQGHGLHADVPDRPRCRRRGCRHRRAGDPVHPAARGRRAGRAAALEEEGDPGAGLRRTTPRCWSGSSRGRGRSTATAARPTATRSFSSRGRTASCSARAAGGLTLYSGGKRGLDVGEGTAEAGRSEAPDRHRAGLPRHRRAARNGKVARFHWPTFPWTKGSYCLLQAGAVDDDRGIGRACRSATCSSPASTAATIFRDT